MTRAHPATPAVLPVLITAIDVTVKCQTELFHPFSLLSNCIWIIHLFHNRKKFALRRKYLIRFRSAVLLIVNRQRYVRVCTPCLCLCGTEGNFWGHLFVKMNKEWANVWSLILLSFCQTVVEPARKAEEVSEGWNKVIVSERSGRDTVWGKRWRCSISV